MRNYSSAAARIQPQQEPGQRNPPPVRTVIFQGERMPPPDPSKTDAAGRQIVEYPIRLQLQQQFESLRAQTVAIQEQAISAREQATSAMKAIQAEHSQLVAMPVAIKKVSLTVLAFCIFAIAIFVSTGVIIVHPFFASIIGTGSLFFYFVGALMAKSDDVA